MSSLIEGYNYDIFISYRQKDNKHDGWVTEFVNNLKGELESTFKEEISVYFDINPHDGLLETHDVDESLKEKLKCLIFIPIISHTYCDPKSFAWEHEFKVFVEKASKDEYGLKVRLPNGNVASRVLPIIIYDLDKQDIKLFESVLQGVLRGVEFIYKSAGVNRPLRANEDHPQDNLNKTYCRDQINKVANAVKEIINAIKHYSLKQYEITQEVSKHVPTADKNKKAPIILSSIVALALIVLGILFIPLLFKPPEKSIAVLPFNLLSDEPDKQYLADGMMDAITLHLSKIKDLRVLGRTSTEQYRNPTKTLTAIGRDLDVSYLLEGSFQKFEDSVRLIVQLIKVGKEAHIWANNYDRSWKNVFSVQSEVAQTIAKELKAAITPEEISLIEEIPAINMRSYDLFLKANDCETKFRKTGDISFYETAINLYRISFEIDTTFALAYVGLAQAYFDRYSWQEYFNETFLDSCLSLLNIALSINDKLDEAYYLKGVYTMLEGNVEEALNNYGKAIKINPNYYSAYVETGNLYARFLFNNVKSLENYHEALLRVMGKERPSLLRTLGKEYANLGFIEKAKFYYQEAFNIDNNESKYLYCLAGIEFNLENYEESLRLLKKGLNIDSTLFIELYFYIYPPGHIDEAYDNANRLIERSKKSGSLMIDCSHRIGYVLYQMGKINEANYYLRQQIKYSEESIRLNRYYAQNKAAHYDLAATYAFLGDKNKAFKNLDEFNTMDYFNLRFYSLVKGDPLFASINNEEQFQEILQNMKSKFQSEHERVKKWLEEKGML